MHTNDLVFITAPFKRGFDFTRNRSSLPDLLELNHHNYKAPPNSGMELFIIINMQAGDKIS